VAGIAEAILTKVIGTGVSRMGGMGFQKFLRIRKIDAAVRGAKSLDPAAQKAFGDFDTLIASRYGELTTEVDKFFRELESSGLITILAEEAIVKKRTDGTRNAFLQLHLAVLGDDAGDAKTMYERLATAFETELLPVWMTPG